MSPISSRRRERSIGQDYRIGRILRKDAVIVPLPRTRELRATNAIAGEDSRRDRDGR